MRIDQKENGRKNFRRRGAAVPEALPLTLQSAKNGSSSSKLSKYSLAFQGLSSFLSITSRGAVTPPRSPLSFQIYTPPSTARVFVLGEAERARLVGQDTDTRSLARTVEDLSSCVAQLLNLKT